MLPSVASSWKGRLLLCDDVVPIHLLLVVVYFAHMGLRLTVSCYGVGFDVAVCCPLAGKGDRLAF